MYPFIYFQSYKISVYFLTLAIVYCIGIQYFFIRLKNYSSLRPTIAADFLLILMISGFIGARLFYVFYQEPNFYFSDIEQIFYVWNGGFVYYGGFIVGLLSGLVYLKLKNQKVLMWLDVSAPVAALSYGLGRFACFFNGCCYGSETKSFLGMHFPHLTGLRHPTQLYAVFYELIAWIVLMILERKLNFYKQHKGALFMSWLVLHGFGRLIMEYFRDDFRGNLILGMSVSSVISIGLILIGAGFLQIFKNNN